MRQSFLLFICLGIATSVAGLTQYLIANNVSTYRVTVTQGGQVVDEAVIQVRPEDKVGMKMLAHQAYTQSSSVTYNQAGVPVARHDTQGSIESGLSASISRTKAHLTLLNVSYATPAELTRTETPDGVAIDSPSQDVRQWQVPLDLAVNHSRQWVLNPTTGIFPAVPNPNPLTMTVTRLNKEGLTAL